MDTSPDVNKKSIYEDLSREELIAKCKNFIIFAQKAKHTKDAIIEENNKLREQLNKQQSFSSEQIIEKLTQQKADLLTNLEELKSQKIHLNNKFQQCEIQLHDAKSNISDLDTANQSYKRRVDRLTEENEQLIVHLDELEKQIDELKNVGLQQQQQLLALEKNNVLLAQTNVNIKEQLNEQNKNKNDSQIVELQKMLGVSLEEVKYLKTENSNLNGNIKNFETLINENQEKISLKDNELKEKNKIIDSLQVKFVEIENNERVLQENIDSKKKIEQLQDELKQSQNNINELKQELDNKNMKIEDNENVVDDLKTDLYKNKALVEKLNQDIFHINHKLSDSQIISSGVTSDLQNANEKLRGKLKLYHSKIVKFASDVKHLQQSKLELLSTFKTYTIQVSEWKERLNLLLNKIECQDKENEEIILQNKCYKETIDMKINENEMLLKTLKEFEKYEDNFEETEKLKHSNKDLKDELNLLQQKLSETEKEITNWNEKYLNICQEKELLEKTIQNLQEQYNNLEKNNSADQNVLTNLQNQLQITKQQYDEEIKKLKDEYKENSEKLHYEDMALKEQINLLQEKLSNAETEVLNSDQRCNNLQKEAHNVEIVINHLEQNYKELQREHSECDSELINLQNTLKGNCEKYEEEIKCWQNKYENQNVKFLQLQTESHETTQTLIEEKNILKNDIEKYLEENKILTTNEENMKLCINDLTIKINKLNSLQEKLEETQSIIESLEHQLRQSSLTIEEKNKTIKDCETANNVLKNELNILNSKEQELAEKSGEEIISQVRKNKELLDKIKSLEDKIPSVEKEIQTGSDLYNFEETLNSLKRENSELLLEMNEMNQALKERGETISNQEALCEDMLKKMQCYESQINDIKNILINKDDIIASLKRDIESLKSENESTIALDSKVDTKDEEINQLKVEIQDLQHKLSISQSEMHLETSYAESENMSTSTISRTEEISRMKDLDSSWEERYGKLRNLAIKLKGRIRELTAELQKEQADKTELQQKHAKTIQTFQSQIDKLHDDYDASKNENKQYLKKFDSVALEVSKDKKQLAEYDDAISQLKSEIDGLNKDKLNTENWKKQVSAKVQIMKKELDANTVLKKDFENKINKLNVELESKDKALKQEIERHNQTKTILQESNNECKKQSVLNLEMQDYERSVKDLSQKNDKKQELINKLKSQIETQKTTLNSLKDKNQELDDCIKNWEGTCDKLKSENEFNKKKITEFENTLSEKENKLQDQMYMIETIRSDNEDLSTQLSKAIAEHQKINNGLKEECDVLKGRNMGLEQTLRQVQNVLKLKEQECSEMQKEYHSYKVRAQSVLRQNQNRDVGIEEKLMEEAASLRAQVDIVGTELKEVRLNLSKTSSENEQLQSELEELRTKIASFEASDENHRTSYEQLLAKHQQVVSEHAEAARGLKVQNETLVQCYRQQLSEQETRHNREIIELQSRMDKSNTPPENSMIMPSMPREEGEGSESVDSVINNGMHPIPLEKLLSDKTEQEVTTMKKQLLENESKVVHLTALLADTEQDLAKYVQLNKVLKEEIRRQQRSAEREKHAENLEYLKNVVFKFITLGNGDERTRLVPVLNTILKLSPEETQKLNSVAKGEKGWSNYLPMSWGLPNKPQ